VRADGCADCTRARRDGGARREASLDEAISRPRSSHTWSTRLFVPSSTRSAPGRSRARAAAWSRAAARSRGVRKVRAAPVPARCARAVHRWRPHLCQGSPQLRVEGQPQGARAAFRSALADHVRAGSLAVLDTADFAEPSTRAAVALIKAAGLAQPLVVVLTDNELSAAKSFRNLERVAVVSPSELEVGAVVWARALLLSEAALSQLEGGCADARGPNRARSDRLGEELPRKRQRYVHLPRP